MIQDLRLLKPATIQDFTDLQTWQYGHNLVLAVYKTTKSFPKSEIFSLTDQMRRASTSITSNIAEGFGRQSYKEKVQFYYLAQGSLTELKNQLYIAKDVGYMNQTEFDELFKQSCVVHQLLQGLIKKTKSYIKKS